MQESEAQGIAQEWICPPEPTKYLASGTDIKSLEFLLGFTTPREPDLVKYSVKSSS